MLIECASHAANPLDEPACTQLLDRIPPTCAGPVAGVLAAAPAITNPCDEAQAKPLLHGAVAEALRCVLASDHELRHEATPLLGAFSWTTLASVFCDGPGRGNATTAAAEASPAGTGGMPTSTLRFLTVVAYTLVLVAHGIVLCLAHDSDDDSASCVSSSSAKSRRRVAARHVPIATAVDEDEEEEHTNIIGA